MPTEQQVKDFLARVKREPNNAPGDQSVYVLLGSVIIDHFPPNFFWTLPEIHNPKTGAVEGIALDIYEIRPDQQTRRVKHYPPGEWTWVGRSTPQ